MVVESGVDRRHSRPLAADLLTNEAPDTGSLAGDLEAVVERVGRNDNDMVTSDLVLRVAIEATRDPELATALDELMLFRESGCSLWFWRRRGPR